MARQLNSSEIDAFEAINQFSWPRSNADAQREEDIIEIIDLTAEDEQEATDLVQATLVSSTRPEKRRLDYNFSPVSNKRLKIYTAVQDQHIEYDGDDEDEARLVPRSPDTSPLGPRESVFEIQQLPTSPASSPNGPSDCSIEAQHSPSPQRWTDDGESSDGYASTLGGGRSPVYTPYPSLVVEEDEPEKEEENNHGGDHVFQPQQADDLTLTGPSSIVEPDFNQLVLQYLERNQQLNAVISASKSIRSSSKLKKILEIILAFGNYMNSGKRGSAYGFRLQSLDLLLDMKSTDRKQTLLHFIVSIIQDKYPQLSNFHTELHFLDKAALVSLDSVLSDVCSLQKGMDVVCKELEQQQDSSVLTQFIRTNRGLLDTLIKDSTTAQEAYQSVVEYFGENPKSTPPSAFFPVFTRFIKAYKLCEQEIDQRRKRLSDSEETADLKFSDAPVHRQKPLRLPQLDLISELKRRQMSPLVREGKDGAIEDIITDLRNQPYIRADGGRRSAKWKPAQQLAVSTDISL